MGNRSSQNGFDLDHTLDEMKEVRLSSMKSSITDDQISVISDRSHVKLTEEQIVSTLLETPEEKKARIRSHWVVYLTTLNVSIGFSIVLTGVYPYLKLLEDDPNLSKTKAGWVIAANPLGQLIASPIAGYAGNKLGGIRYVCYFTMACFALGSLLYGLLPAMDELWDHSAFHLMMLARFIVGLSSSNITLCRSYVAGATTLAERTKAISLISASQALGFIIGPALQVVLSLVLSDDISKYRSAGFFAAIMAIGNLILLTPLVFKEFNIAAKEMEFARRNNPTPGDIKLPKVDYLALGSILFGFFLVQFVYVLIESLMEPFVQDQYAWCDDMAVVVVGVSLMFCGVLTICVFMLAAKLAKFMDERIILTALGFGMIILGLICYLPWGSGKLILCPEVTTNTTEEFIMFHPLELQDMTEWSTESTIGTTEYWEKSFDERSDLFQNLCEEFSNSTECLGCPPDQTWCEDVPMLNLWQFFLGLIFIITGYPFGVSMSNSIYSKILGPKPQGLWMGILTSAGSFARVLGPIFVTYVYSGLGTRYTFGILTVAMALGLVQLIIFMKRLVPMKPIKIETEGRY